MAQNKFDKAEFQKKFLDNRYKRPYNIVVNAIFYGP